MIIGDKCVANCRECGVFIPKVRASTNNLTNSSLSIVQNGVRTIRNDNQAFQCCFPMTEILRTTYALCMQCHPMSVHP